jgi:endonuclease/exonuclease/phosphatase family metal-dependent hydrolase
VTITALAVAAGSACHRDAVWHAPVAPVRTVGGGVLAAPPPEASAFPPAAHEASAVRWMQGPAGDRARLERWRAGVGPVVVYRPDSMGPPPGAAALRDLPVVSWNTNVGGGDLDGLVDDLRSGRLTDGDSVAHFVLLLQEVFRRGPAVPRGLADRPRRIAALPPRGPRSDVVEVARRHGLFLFYVPSMANGWEADGDQAEDRGNAIVSTIPLAGLTAIELPFEGQRRVAASAIVPGDGEAGHAPPLRVVSVHLDNRSVLRRVYRSFGSGRTRQAEALASALARDPAADLPTVLAGDLNTWGPSAWERAVHVLRAHFPQGSALNVPTFAGRSLMVGRTLDHMMFRLPVPRATSQRPSGPSAGETERRAAFVPPLPVRLDDARGSDHYPLLARLLVGDGG